MHFYQKNIGDFNNATRHLTRVERSLFSDAIELYYDTEKPLTSDINKLNRLLLAHSQEEKDALLVVLNEFFTLTDEGYFNKRCNEEIVKYQAYMESKSKAGKASAEQRAKQKSTGVEHVLNTTPTKHNHEPITNNQETLNKKPTQKNEFFADIDSDVYQAWLSVRKAKRGGKISKIVYDAVAREALKAGLTIEEAVRECAERNWITFNADWYEKANPKNVVRLQPKTKMDISGIDYKAGVNPDGSF
jgi:uncharacterized protein YdaU (DUF1376 family)